MQFRSRTEFQYGQNQAQIDDDHICLSCQAKIAIFIKLKRIFLSLYNIVLPPNTSGHNLINFIANKLDTIVFN